MESVVNIIIANTYFYSTLLTQNFNVVYYIQNTKN
jgi:hypothetical protein